MYELNLLKGFGSMFRVKLLGSFLLLLMTIFNAQVALAQGEMYREATRVNAPGDIPYGNIGLSDKVMDDSANSRIIEFGPGRSIVIKLTLPADGDYRISFDGAWNHTSSSGGYGAVTTNQQTATVSVANVYKNVFLVPKTSSWDTYKSVNFDLTDCKKGDIDITISYHSANYVGNLKNFRCDYAGIHKTVPCDIPVTDILTYEGSNKMHDNSGCIGYFVKGTYCVIPLNIPYDGNYMLTFISSNQGSNIGHATISTSDANVGITVDGENTNDLTVKKTSSWTTYSNSHSVLLTNCKTGYLDVTLTYKSGDYVGNLKNFNVALDAISRSTQGIKYGTICLPFDFTPTGATIYNISNIETDKLTLEEVVNPQAGVPYIYQATGTGSQTFTKNNAANTAATPQSTTNGLVGTFELTPVPAGCYVMQTQNGVQGFYRVGTAGTIYSGHWKAYLAVDNEAKALFFGDREDTAIDALNIVIGGNAQIFDLSGRKLHKLQQGVNIVNGKKIVVR